ncbi:hypothetical protein SCANM63S_05906 [Streptomyces canarius]
MQGLVQKRVEGCAHGVERPGEHRELAVQPQPHAQPLAALSGEERQAPLRGEQGAGHRPQGGTDRVAVLARHDGPVFEVRAWAVARV